MVRSRAGRRRAGARWGRGVGRRRAWWEQWQSRREAMGWEEAKQVGAVEIEVGGDSSNAVEVLKLLSKSQGDEAWLVGGNKTAWRVKV